MRPPLTKSISLEDFQNYYWLKAELQTFCREHGLPASGSKTEITERISHYLTTGKVLKNSSVQKVSKAPLSYKDLSLQTIITKNHRCSEDVRAFFKEKIGTNFRFTVALQKFFKENVGKTYEDAITFWYEENERKKDPTYKTTISAQFEYNRFTRDFFEDPNNKGKTKADAIAAWNEMKAKPGSNVYVPQKVEN
ncbi:TPA: SAP domain-containing protein [Bacillus cereus]|nr:SAP domain-containing protein [Bacillus cereus]HDR4540855.1 SAP domain-containing protein [Bacillus cereus]HDR4840933.1 SAP domain-containing protein [Bacillus cereus]HDR4887055.1 SAP domain-containing protein [Bacillus cereus]HDR8080821.1 SAP domain-containing protein [Bacillus cereus]